MTTKCPSLYDICDSQLSKKNKGQENIIAFQYPKITEIKEIEINKCNSHFSSYRKKHCIATESWSFHETKEYISSKIMKDNRRIQSIFSDYEFLGSILIKDYFQEHPNKRKALAQNVAKHITSVNVVLEVLDWGTSRKIREGFDATVMLLAECGNIIISTVNHLPEPSPDNKNLNILERKWEILITSIACTSNISAQKRFDSIIRLIPDSKRRSVKIAIIDALLIMEDEIDVECIKNQLEHFLSDSEHDEYVKECAKEALEDM
jgi:hypothetical protein